MHHIACDVVTPPRSMMRAEQLASPLDISIGLPQRHGGVHVYWHVLTKCAQAIFHINVLDEIVFPKCPKLAVGCGGNRRPGRDNAHRRKQPLCLFVNANWLWE